MLSIQEIIGILITLTAICSYLNYRFFKLTPSIGITSIALVSSTVFLIANKTGLVHISAVTQLIEATDFNAAFMQGMLGFLLFAGALHVNSLELAKQKWIIVSLATIGVIISTMIVGLLMYLVANYLNINFPLIDCFVFGALIAPTDPIAVFGVLKKIQAPKALEMTIAGESLFNDGTGIALFVVLLGLAYNDNSFSLNNIVLLFLRQVCGGILYGLVIGFIANFLLRKVNDFHVSVLITLALVTGGYMLALNLDVSGPIAMVVAGLVVGATIRSGAMSEGTIRQLDSFWILVDETLNAILFVFIGLELLNIPLTMDAFIGASVAIPIVLIARYISVAMPVLVFKPFKNITPKAVGIMTWGGLRGGVSIALALSLQVSPVRDEMISVTYAVVVFSLLVQGLTIDPFIRYALKKSHEKISE